MSARTGEGIPRHNIDVRGVVCPAEWVWLCVDDDGIASIVAIARTKAEADQLWDIADKIAPQGELVLTRIRKVEFDLGSTIIDYASDGT